MVSGSGTLLEAMIENGLPIRVVATDRPCRAQEVTRTHGLDLVVLERTDFSPSFDREAYTDHLVSRLINYDIGLVAMAGFGTILGGSIYQHFPDRVLNTHPALLPKHKGWHAVSDALSAGDKITGCTIHLATAEVDEGPILAQEVVPILEGDTEEVLHERIKEVERRLYPSTILTYLAYLEWLEIQWSPGTSPGGPVLSKPRWVGRI